MTILQHIMLIIMLVIIGIIASILEGPSEMCKRYNFEL